jgi:hypothetical protein
MLPPAVTRGMIGVFEHCQRDAAIPRAASRPVAVEAMLGAQGQPLR